MNDENPIDEMAVEYIRFIRFLADNNTYTPIKLIAIYLGVDIDLVKQISEDYGTLGYIDFSMQGMYKLTKRGLAFANNPE